MPKSPVGTVKAMKPVTAKGQENPATAGVEQDRIMTRIKRPVRTKVPRVI